jgi:hypothetical protein
MMKKLLSILAALVLTVTVVSPVGAWEDLDPREQSQWSTDYPITVGGGPITEVPVCLLSNFDAPNGGWDTSVVRIARVKNAMAEVNRQGQVPFDYVTTNTACSNMNPSFRSGYVFLQVGYGTCNTGQIACYRRLNWNVLCITHCLRSASISIVENGGAALAGDPWYFGGANTYSGNKWGFEEVIVHEFGHTLALDHNAVTSSIMCSENNSPNCATRDRIHAESGSETMQPYFHTDDVNGINAMWP